MEPYSLFKNEAGRLRSGWRVCLYFILFYLLGIAASMVFFVEDSLGLKQHIFLNNLIFRFIFLGAAALAGWLCNYFIESLPWRALGLSFHAGWWRDFLIGSVIGALSLAIAISIVLVAGGLRLETSAGETWFPMMRALAATGFLFIVAALAEEAAFRGYPLQTMCRPHLAWVGVLITSVPFAIIHWRNPGATVFSTLNTALAGVWLAAAYLRTRSLWFPLGVHWSWNWVQGSIFGDYVSGTVITTHSVLHAIDKGPEWLTGGSYGIEGGLGCTIALVISTAFIRRTRLVSATPELLKLTSEENPVSKDEPMRIY